jgi:hypothetical protein
MDGGDMLKRIADWLEKIARHSWSDLFSQIRALLPLLGLALCAWAFPCTSPKKGENMISGTMIWVVGLVCAVIGVASVYALKKGWLK